MTETEILEENPLTLAELRDHLEKTKTVRDLSFRGNKTLDYVRVFAKHSAKEAQEIKEKLSALDLLRLKEKHIVKLIDLQPSDIDTVKTILSGENITMKQEELQKVLECLK